MEITIIKGETSDAIRIRRKDGSLAETTFPKKGPIPHDAVHLIVEEELGLSNGFWGMIDAGRRPEEIQEIAKAAGHASAKRPKPPDGHIIELIQAERLVECFEAEVWSEPADIETFRSIAVAACAHSLAPAPTMSDTAIMKIRERLEALTKTWAVAPVGDSIAFTWNSLKTASERRK